MKPLLIAWTGLAMMALSLPATAQTKTQTPGVQQPCQAEPDQRQDQGQKTNGEERQGSGDLTGKLAPCGGVLKPPPTGDDEATRPAPDEGRTPVIKPGEVPPQAPKQD